MYGLLINNPVYSQANGYFLSETLLQDLSSLVRDHYKHVIETMSILIDICSDLLRESTIINMLTLCEVLIQKNVPDVRFIFLSIMRLIKPNFVDKQSVRRISFNKNKASHIPNHGYNLSSAAFFCHIVASIPKLRFLQVSKNGLRAY